MRKLAPVTIKARQNPKDGSARTWELEPAAIKNNGAAEQQCQSPAQNF